MKSASRLMILYAAALVLSGCAAVPRPATIYQGECRVFADPGFRVRGVTTADKRWIATTQEAGIQVCGWKRPPSMPEPQVAQAMAEFDCSTVHQVVGMFGGDAARAEAYAVSQGATPEHIAAARQCLEQPMPVKAERPGLGSRHRMTRAAQKRYVDATPAAVAPVAPAAAAPPVLAAKPTLRQRTKARYERTKARVKGWFKQKQ